MLLNKNGGGPNEVDVGEVTHGGKLYLRFVAAYNVITTLSVALNTQTKWSANRFDPAWRNAFYNDFNMGGL